jgi:hypothetical protein
MGSPTIKSFGKSTIIFEESCTIHMMLAIGISVNGCTSTASGAMVNVVPWMSSEMISGPNQIFSYWS